MGRRALGLATLSAPLLGGAKKTAKFIVTTTGAQTLTIQDLTIATGRAVVVNWGDGSSSDYTGSGTRTHNYASAGVWTVTITDANFVTKFDLRDSKVTQFNSADIAGMPLTYLYLYLPAATGAFDSADIAGMPLTYLYLYLPAMTVTFNSADIASMALTTLHLSMTAVTGTFDSADVAGMALTYLHLYLPSATVTFDSADIASMALTYLRLYLPSATVTFDSADIASMALTYLFLDLPSATVTFDSADIASMALTYLRLDLPSATVTFDSADIASMALTTLNLYLPSATTTTIARVDWAGVVVRAVPSPTIQMGLSQTEVDNVLLGIYDGFAARTANAGTLDVAGNNAAPSGTLQAQCPPTTGKEAAYELVNDSCGVSTKHYAAVTLTA